jgi:glycosidase
MTFAKPDRRWQRLKLAATFLLTTRGSVQWYYGDEIGMEGGDDPDNRRDFPGGFPKDLRNAFLSQGRTTEENALWAWVRQLFRLRRQLPWLATAPTHWWQVEADTLIYERRHKGQRLFVLLHRGAKPLGWTLPSANGRLVAGEGKLQRVGGKWHVWVPPWGAALILSR